jgi:hypothetical protein
MRCLEGWALENKWICFRQGVWVKTNRYSDFRVWVTVRVLCKGMYMYDMFEYRRDHLKEDVDVSVDKLIKKYNEREVLRDGGVNKSRSLY